MNALEQNKGAILGGVILLAALFAYNAFFGGDTAVATPSAASAGADLIKVSENISKATLSRDLFSKTPYQRLFDFSLPLQPEPAGRSNPFAPIGQE